MRDPVIVATGQRYTEAPRTKHQGRSTTDATTGATPFLPDSDLSLFHKRRRENSKVGGVPYYHSMGSIPNATEGEHVLAVCHSGPVKVAGKAIKWQSTEWMCLSKFCLHPAGDTPSSCGLFDAIVTNCVPVIVSDQIELPCEDELDYTQFSIFFSIKEALEPGYLVTQLRQFPKERWLEMCRQLKSIPHHFEFQYLHQKKKML